MTIRSTSNPGEQALMNRVVNERLAAGVQRSMAWQEGRGLTKRDLPEGVYEKIDALGDRDRFVTRDELATAIGKLDSAKRAQLAERVEAAEKHLVRQPKPNPGSTVVGMVAPLAVMAIFGVIFRAPSWAIVWGTGAAGTLATGLGLGALWEKAHKPFNDQAKANAKAVAEVFQGFGG